MVCLLSRICAIANIMSLVVPHPVGASPTDITSFVYGQASITINTWPEFMYMLSPTPEWRAARGSPKPAQKIDHNGQPVWERYPVVGQPARALLDYKGLPDTVRAPNFSIYKLTNSSSDLYPRGLVVV